VKNGKIQGHDKRKTANSFEFTIFHLCLVPRNFLASRSHGEEGGEVVRPGGLATDIFLPARLRHSGGLKNSSAPSHSPSLVPIFNSPNDHKQKPKNHHQRWFPSFCALCRVALAKWCGQGIGHT
jgi:hypothetical protein